MIKKILLGTLGLVMIAVGTIVTLAFFPTSLTNASISGFHLRPAHWSGTITVVGDAWFAPWVALTIEPGTRILFGKNPDIPNTDWTEFADAYIKDHHDPTGHTGYNDSHFDLAARINAVGTKERPIVFTSAQAKPEYADWDQLVVLGGTILDHVELAYAHNGIYVGTAGIPFIGHKQVTITNSTFHDSLWSCIDVWSSTVRITNNEVYHCWHQGIGVKKVSTILIKDNFIHDAQLSINCEEGARPTITHNHFAAAPRNPDCPTGSDNQDIGRVADTSGGTYQGKVIYPSNAATP